MGLSALSLSSGQRVQRLSVLVPIAVVRQLPDEGGDQPPERHPRHSAASGAPRTTRKAQKGHQVLEKTLSPRNSIESARVLLGEIPNFVLYKALSAVNIHRTTRLLRVIS